MVKIIPLSAFMHRLEVKKGLKGTAARKFVAAFFKVGIASVYRYEKDKVSVLVDSSAKTTKLVIEISEAQKVI